MKAKARNIRAVVSLVLYVTLACFSQDTPTTSPLVAELRSSDLATRLAAARRILQEHRITVDGLIAIVEQETDGENLETEFALRRIAIGLLGELRDPKAIPVLMKHLKYEVEVSAGSTGAALDPGNTHPAVAALAQIGHPALERVWYRVEMSDDPVERELCTYILGKIQGREAVGLLIEGKIAKADRQRKPRLEAARAVLDKYAIPVR